MQSHHYANRALFFSLNDEASRIVCAFLVSSICILTEIKPDGINREQLVTPSSSSTFHHLAHGWPLILLCRGLGLQPDQENRDPPVLASVAEQARCTFSDVLLPYRSFKKERMKPSTQFLPYISAAATGQGAKKPREPSRMSLKGQPAFSLMSKREYSMLPFA